MIDPKNTITAAQELAAHFGWAVFPVNPKTKTPYFRGWQQMASSDPADIEKSFSGLRYMAIGIQTGTASNLVVIDIDERPTFSGLRNFENAGYQIEEGHMVARSPSGGLHLYFRQPHFKVPNSVSLLAQGVDVRGEGGYIISPPSTTIFGSYTWACCEEILLRGARNLPPTIVRTLEEPAKRHRPRKSNSGLANQILAPLPKGCRNQEITRRCGHLLGKYNADDSWEMIKLINQQCCIPPLPEKELLNTFRSIRAKEGK